MRKNFYAKYALLIVMAFLFVTPFLLQGAHRAIRSNTNKVQDWLPKDFKETVELREFRKHFTADQFVVISWPGCEMGDDPLAPDANGDDLRIERLAKYLVPKKRPKGEEWAATDHTRYFQSVTTARRTLNELTSKPSEVPYREAVKRLTGTLLGPDGHQTCVVVMLSDPAIKDFRSVVGRRVPDGPLPWQRKPGVLIEALRACQIDPEQVYLGGPPVENVAIDEEGDRTLSRLAVLAGGLGLGLAWWSLRSFGMTLIVFGCGVLSAAAGLAFVYWTGQTTDAIMMSMPSMLYVLAISGAIHIVNYYREAVHEYGYEGAPAHAMGHGWKPALLCNVTTGIGLGSLCTANIEPIRKFGVYSAAGVVIMLVFLFLFLPSALELWPAKLKWKDEEDADEAVVGEGTIWSQALWSRFSMGIIRHHTAVAAACFAIIFIASLGLARVHTNIDLLKLFDESVRVRQDYAWLEDHIGPLVPLEVVVSFPARKMRSATDEVDAVTAARKVSFLERLELIGLMQQTIDKELGAQGRDLVGPSMSPVTFAPPLPPGNGDSWSLARRVVTNKKLEESQSALERSGYLNHDRQTGAEMWRISLRAAAFANLDYGVFVNSVRSAVEPVLAAQRMREQVFGNVAAKRGAIAGSSVCLWDRSNSDPQTIKSLPLDSPERQYQIYSTASQDLLGRARLRLTAASVNFSKLDEKQRQAAIDHFKSFDCVAVIGDVSNDEIAKLQAAGATIIDAQDELLRHGDDPALLGKSMSAVYTGVVPIVYKAQRALLDSLIQSSFWSFITITPLIILVCHSVAGGLVVMLPNVLPVLVIFGGMGWLNVPIDIGSMMAASIALGVAVDDTIHYLIWYREGLNLLRDRHQAIVYAYRRCAPPTLQAALISGLGLAVFTFSTFTPTQRMGWLMMTILIAGVIAELIMMPAILAGPLGKAFKPGKIKQAPAAHVPSPHAPQRQTHLVSSQV